MSKPAISTDKTRTRRSARPARSPVLEFGGGPPVAAPQIVSNAVLGMLIFVVVEVMLFAGLISAFMIVKAAAIGGWPPPGQPRLPLEQTAVNTVALLMSGVFLIGAHRAFRRDPPAARIPLLISILLGSFFVIFQGVEWLALIREGLTLTSSNHGSFFYLIVGAHATHAVAALIALGYVWVQLVRAQAIPSRLHAAEIFWYFVVGVWPILYLQVYL